MCFLISIYIFNLFLISQKVIKNADLSINPTTCINENKITINNESKINIIKNSNNSEQTPNNKINNNNIIKDEILEIDDKNNIIKDEILEIDDKNNKISMNINSNFKSANFLYVTNKKTICSNQSKNKELNVNENKYLNKNQEILHPLIHFTNLSSKKLKILGSSSKSKTDNDKNDI